MQTRLANTWCVIEEVEVPTWYIEPVEMSDEEIEEMFEQVKEVLAEGDIEEVEHDTKVVLQPFTYFNEYFFRDVMRHLGHGTESHNEEDQEAS